MTEWREVTLGDVCTLKRGYDLPTAQRHVGTVPIVSSSGISGFHSEPKVRGPGVVTGRYGTLGRVFYVKEDFWPLNTSLYVSDFKGNTPRFVAALLEVLDLGRDAGAAAVPGVNRNHLHALQVCVPDIGYQRRMVGLLNALDDLIENNRRRIELLEQMAQAIYREWFVKFRYPGHETVPLVDSPLGPIPEGWGAMESGDLIRRGLLEIGDGYRAKNVEMVASGVGLPFVRVGNVLDGFLDLEKCDQLPVEYLERLGAKVSRAGDAVISMKGTVGRSALVEAGHPPLAYSPQVSYWRTLTPSTIPSSFLYLWIRGDDFRAQCASVKGATDMADYVNLRDQRKMILLVPTESVVQRFDVVVDPLLRIRGQVRALNNTLTSLRDLLLPKLVTGQIDVSKLDLDGLLESVA